MGELFETIIPVGAEHVIYDRKEAWDYRVRVKAGTWKGDHLFRAGSWLFADQQGKEWLKKQCKGWIEFVRRP